jgi:hypothetical protein
MVGSGTLLSRLLSSMVALRSIRHSVLFSGLVTIRSPEGRFKAARESGFGGT